MRFQQLNRTDGDKVFVAVRNVSGGTMSAGAAAYLDGTTIDGNAVSGARTNRQFLFKGILDSALSDSSYGEALVHGIASAYYCPGNSSISAVAGAQLVGVTSQNYLSKDPTTVIVGSSSAYTIGTTWPFVTLAEDVASAAALSNTPTLVKVFVRAL